MNRDQIAEVMSQKLEGCPLAHLTRSYRTRVLAAADAIMALDGWQTIDSAPRDGTWVLLWARGVMHHAVNAGPSDDAIRANGIPRYEWFSVSRMAPVTDPTHWRPLPQPPGDAG